ncbi:MAG: hypothetical protein LBJ36_11640 [Synergistaceae bacterium]|nr:hypothetical protein [Synergistaceae bacterium]
MNVPDAGGKAVFLGCLELVQGELVDEFFVTGETDFAVISRDGKTDDKRSPQSLRRFLLRIILRIIDEGDEAIGGGVSVTAAIIIIYRKKGLLSQLLGNGAIQFRGRVVQGVGDIEHYSCHA